LAGGDHFLQLWTNHFPFLVAGAKLLLNIVESIHRPKADAWLSRWISAGPAGAIGWRLSECARCQPSTQHGNYKPGLHGRLLCKKGGVADGQNHSEEIIKARLRHYVFFALPESLAQILLCARATIAAPLAKWNA
jgi:hypothetical protein